MLKVILTFLIAATLKVQGIAVPTVAISNFKKQQAKAIKKAQKDTQEETDRPTGPAVFIQETGVPIWRLIKKKKKKRKKKKQRKKEREREGGEGGADRQIAGWTDWLTDCLTD